MKTSPKNEVLREAGTSACLLGNAAIARGALEAGLQFFSCYPGTPSSEVADTLARVAGDAGLRFEYSINEKVAVEIAFGACLTGARSMCSMKHVGLSYAMDPASTMPYVGVEGGMVIVSAGDPSAITSSNEQDQRHLTRMLLYPVFDPATPADALEMTRYAFGFSEKTRLPVIMRPTTRICHSGGIVKFGPLPEKRNEIGFKKAPSRHVPLPANARRMRKELTERYALAEELLSRSDFFPREGAGKSGIIASGVAYAYARQVVSELGLEDEVTLQKVGAYPIPEGVLSDFLSSVDRVLVVEELTPFVEDWVTLSAYRKGVQVPILGKHSGHLPQEFECSPELVEDGIRAFLEMPSRKASAAAVPDLPPRPPVLCPGCPHRTSFYLARKAFGKDTVYVNDIGCYTLAYGKPLDCCDVVLCMGSSITQASGIARNTGKRAVAFLGDSTFFHSGLPGLANALQANDKVTVVILNNYVTAMTGFQPSPMSWAESGGKLAYGGGGSPRAFSIENAVRGLGVKEVFSVDPFEEKAALAAFKKAKAGTGLNVVICNSPCVTYETRSPGFKRAAPYEIDQESCTECVLCVAKLGCPAIHIVGGEYRIDSGLCSGCGLCAKVCNKDAIRIRRDSPNFAKGGRAG